MNQLIGQNLEDALKFLSENNYKVVIKENNHNVVGTKLVTNAILHDDTVILTVGEFILNI